MSGGQGAPELRVPIKDAAYAPHAGSVYGLDCSPFQVGVFHCPICWTNVLPFQVGCCTAFPGGIWCDNAGTRNMKARGRNSSGR